MNWLSFYFLYFLVFSYGAPHQDKGSIIFRKPGYLTIFELDPGEEIEIEWNNQGNNVKRTVKLLSVNHFYEFNSWFHEDMPSRSLQEAVVEVEVSGLRINLIHRPYQMPVDVNGIRLFVETTKEWAGGLDELNDVKKQVRLSARMEGEPWGPDSFLFPIKKYRWRSSTYNNTWSSLVPFNLMYYHRGEDHGIIPDKLDVIAPFDGEIVKSPIPDGDGKSNSLAIENKDGIEVRFSHMNIETIIKEMVVGKQVKKGEMLGKTGMTWDGRKSQHNDPHLHIEFGFQGKKLGSYPFLMESYLRDYPDEVLAVAGGYRFSRPGLEIELDATRSLTRQNNIIQDYEWKLSNGLVINSSKAKITYSSPGLYSEELIVKTKDGKEDRDFVQVRVFDPQFKKDIAYGWGYFYPVRDPIVGSPVLFWNRLVNVKGETTIDFGDGSKALIDKEIEHVYQKSGHYTVTLSASGPRKEPVTVKFEVRVRSAM